MAAKKRQSRKAKNEYRLELAPLTLSSLVAELEEELKAPLTSSELKDFENTKEGVIIDLLYTQLLALDGIMADCRDFINSSLPSILAILRSDGITKAVKNSMKRLPDKLRYSGFDAAYLASIAKEKALIKPIEDVENMEESEVEKLIRKLDHV